LPKKDRANKEVYRKPKEQGNGEKETVYREEKVKILREVLEDGKPVSRVAEEYGVHPNLILNWHRERSSRNSYSRGRRRRSRYGGLTLPGRPRSGRLRGWKKNCGRRTRPSPSWRGKSLP
jgi:transposase-like protein